MTAKSETRRLFTFLWTGGLAAIVNVATRYLFSFFMSYQLAVLLAYLVGMITAFILSRWLVFESSGRPVSEELTKFAIVNVFAALQVWIVSMALNFYLLPWMNWTFEPELVAHLIGVGSPVLTSYLAHKHFSFKPTGK